MTAATKSTTVTASGTCGENLTWTLTDDGTLTISGTGAMTDYSWSPDVPWYSNRSSIKKVILNSGVTTVGDYAFSDCSSLTEITIPDSVTSIGDWTFRSCTSLSEITIPESVLSIGYYAFSHCPSLSSIAIPDSVTSIDGWAFYNCTSLTEITIPSSVTSIGSGTFSLCSSLNGITIPDSVTSIGNSAFFGCTSLTEITIPSSVTSIGDEAFYYCTGFTEITIPDSVTSIGDSAFYNCTGLTEITIPSGVTSIGWEAFSCCTSLTEITIPDSVTSIGDSAFYLCTSLINIFVDDENGNYSDKDGVLYSGTELSCYPAGRSGAYAIPSGTTNIGSVAFCSCTNLTEITIPSGVTSIGDDAFRSCTSLTEITIPSGVTSIGDSTFSSCSSLTEITIPDSVTSIGEYAFSRCTSLNGITIPDSVTSIDGWAFQFCTSLTEITFEGTTPPSIVSYAFRNVTATAYYPATELWTEDDRQNYGGTITWVAIEACQHTDTETVTVNVTCTQDGSLTITCNDCGYILSEEIVEAPGHSFADDVCTRCLANAPQISKSSLTLSGLLRLNITVDLNGLEAEDYILRVQFGNDDNKTTVADSAPKGESVVYTVMIPAHRMQEDVRLELVYGEAVIDAKKWTLEYYYYNLLWEYPDDTKMIALLDGLTDYCTYASYYANPTGTAPNNSAVEAVTRGKLTDYKAFISTGNRDLGATASLYLDDTCDILVKFNASAFEGCTLYVDGDAVTTETVDGKVIYRISEILPQNLSKFYNIKVVNADGVTVYEVDYSVLSYAYTALSQTQEIRTGLNGLLKAMYLYSLSASAYHNA